MAFGLKFWKRSDQNFNPNALWHEIDNAKHYQLSTTLPLHEVGGGKGGGDFSVPKRKEGFQFVYLNFVVFIMKLPMCD